MCEGDVVSVSSWTPWIMPELPLQRLCDRRRNRPTAGEDLAQRGQILGLRVRMIHQGMNAVMAPMAKVVRTSRIAFRTTAGSNRYKGRQGGVGRPDHQIDRRAGAGAQWVTWLEICHAVPCRRMRRPSSLPQRLCVSLLLFPSRSCRRDINCRNHNGRIQAR